MPASHLRRESGSWTHRLGHEAYLWLVGGTRTALEDEIAFTGERAAIVVALDDALLDVQRQDSEKARLLAWLRREMDGKARTRQKKPSNTR
jgi:hypothetical protein